MAKKAPKRKIVASTGFWLMKSEPESYSIDDLKRDGTTLWTGVRNYQARNFMMESMQPGDRFLFYHSNAEPSGVVGAGRIRRPNAPDPTAQDPTSDYYDPKAQPDHPIWFCAEVEFSDKFKRMVTLAEIREKKELANMALLNPGQRLSIQPVTAKEFTSIVKLASDLKILKKT
jgi:predicted RNA-binding protein with PUA-like domain